jgi:hypothetical protein
MSDNNNTKIDLSGLFNSLQNQMIAQLNTNRDFIEHPGSKGDSLENVWIEWLKKYLPNRYCVDKAIIVDSTGQLSQQIDLVIYDQQYTPFVFTQNGIHYIPAEGVYAVFEVKPDLQGNVVVNGESLSYIEYAGRKIESARKLKRTSTQIIDRGRICDARPLTKIIGGILSSVNTYVQRETIENHIKKLTELKTLDMGCAVEYGSFYVNFIGEEDGGITDFNARIKQYYSSRKFDFIGFSNSDKSLVTFFLQLSRYLQQSIGTVAAIDLNAYAQTVNFSIDQSI